MTTSFTIVNYLVVADRFGIFLTEIREEQAMGAQKPDG
jgi:hypothetical protein